jgi:outer membrane murein-binding lipoprotein Lpp
MLRRLHEWFSTSSWTVRGRVNALHAKVDRLADAVERLQAAQARDDKRDLSGKLDRLAEEVAEIHGAQKQDEKWKSLFRRQMNSVIRYFYLVDSDVAAPHALAGRRFRLRSQNEEDGIVLALLKAGALRTRRFVEIGSGGTDGNSGVLAADFGWSGLMVPASAKAASESPS